jgi:hypothetical protein
MNVVNNAIFIEFMYEVSINDELIVKFMTEEQYEIYGISSLKI